MPEESYHIDKLGRIVKLMHKPRNELAPACKLCMYNCLDFDDDNYPLPLDDDGSEVDCLKNGYFVQVSNDDEK